MDLSEPTAVICPSLEGPVLMALAATNRPLSAREVSRLARRGSWEGVRRVLLRLTEHGIVRVQEVGNLTQYALNRSHVAFPAVELLADLRNEVVRRLSRTIRDWQIEASHASLFGSAARGDGGTSSDIDLLIIRPAGLSEDDVRWREQLDALARAVLDWTGNRAAIAELSTRELTHVQSSTTGEIRRDAITLAGRDIGELLEAVR